MRAIMGSGNIRPSSSGCSHLSISELREKHHWELENLTLTSQPFKTLKFFTLAVIQYIKKTSLYLLAKGGWVMLFSVAVGTLGIVLMTLGCLHEKHLEELLEYFRFGLWWVPLGVASSIGLGSGLHTFVLYLGPHIALFTLKAVQCGRVDLKSAPYDTTQLSRSASWLDKNCSEFGPPLFQSVYDSQVPLSSILPQVQLEAILWGIGTAIGELPPYFISRAARLSGSRVDAMEELDSEDKRVLSRIKCWFLSHSQHLNFFTILVLASVPNPLFDLAGIMCGQFGIPFWKFFLATLIGKAIIKTHIQTIFIISVCNNQLLHWIENEKTERVLWSGAMEDAGGKIVKSGQVSRKVVDVAAGEAHTLLLTGDGSVYCWGKGMFGRLGTGAEKDELLPVQLNFGYPNPNGTEGTFKIVGIAAGAYHSLALAEDGAVWCWGYNFYGQLGINGEESHDNEYAVGDNSLVPRILNKFLELHPPDSSSSGVSEAESKTPLKICAVKAGGMMSLAIDNHGTLWMWGNCPRQSKEGGLALVSSFTPTPVWDFQGHTVVKVACGNEHVVALVSAGETYNGEDLVCYSWGYNSRGQLGLGDRESRLHPEVVRTFDEESPYEVACGAFHTALLTRKKKPSDTVESTCWTFGLGDNGQLGHGTTQSTLFPTPVKELPQNVSLICVDCGLFHTSVVSSDGDVWSWGMEKGLGLCPDASRAGTDSGDALSPRLMSCQPHQLKFPDPVKVACGAAHTVIVARKGYRMWSWGRGRSGVLGDGKGFDCYTPTAVLWPSTMEDSEEEEVKSSGEQDKAREKETELTTETEEKLSSALNELKLLQTKLSIMEKYASILHGSIFGKPFDEQDIPVSLRNSGSFDIAKEWESMLEAADQRKLIRLEMFYRDMLTGVKDELMKRRIKEIVQECLQSSEVKK